MKVKWVYFLPRIYLARRTLDEGIIVMVSRLIKYIWVINLLNIGFTENAAIAVLTAITLRGHKYLKNLQKYVLNIKSHVFLSSNSI